MNADIYFCYSLIFYNLLKPSFTSMSLKMTKTICFPFLKLQLQLQSWSGTLFVLMLFKICSTRLWVVEKGQVGSRGELLLRGLSWVKVCKGTSSGLLVGLGVWWRGYLKGWRCGESLDDRLGEILGERLSWML